MRYRVVVEGRAFEIEVGPDGQVWVDGRPLQVDVEHVDDYLCSLLVNHRSFETSVEAVGEECQVLVTGRPYRARLDTGPLTGGGNGAGSCGGAIADRGEVAAPLPGLLVELRVTEGQWVEAGAVVAVMESMKMHLELRAPRSGVVCSLPLPVGREVLQGEIIAIIGNSSD